ncbi:tyrosine-protein phosphatase [Lactobacillus bombicola]|uniref:Protein-tyrosine-phosphatase n=1 Tax=Lactobacillus bombicola TaxID=1505723 RepID=A0A396SN63_9LACO|nr:tyrosine-protein phosphatase [Lactobacillus bombicola]RHW49501.1 protein-tyrosine-phosphatase [Lactobacillus bombicola]RHW53316.1 protein-tyrosine-phosphatase [Lactobacillus bombicola]
MSDPVVLPVKSVRNPRDLGGYVGIDGRKIKFHRLLRAGNFSKITLKDEQFLLNYGLKEIIDLRSPTECKKNPDRKLPGVKHYHFPLSDEANPGGSKLDMQKEFAKYRCDQYAGFKLMCQRYHNHVLTKRAQASFHQIIQTISKTDKGAVLYHCSEGKDRTGLVTILLLYILGVDMETIRCDYLYSNYLLNEYRAVRDQSFKENGENEMFRANMRVLGSVANTYFDTSLIAINKKYGSLDAYIVNQLGIDPQMQELLREKYLEK